MKKILVLLKLFFVSVLFSHANGQTIYGVNGTNSTSVLNSQNINSINDLVPDASHWIFRFRQDKIDGTVPDSEIQNLINLDDTLSKYGKHLDVIYTFDCLKKTIPENFYAFNLLNAAGVHIAAAEMDNEAYADSAGFHNNWTEFKTKFTPVLNELTRQGFTEKIIFPIAPRPAGSEIAGGNSKHKIWNDAAAPFINSSPQYDPVFHVYYSQFDAPIMSTLKKDKLPENVYTGQYIPEKDTFYRKLSEQIMASPLLEATVTYMSTKFPSKKMWMTEYGPAASTGNLQNTIGFHITDLWFLNQTLKYQDKIAVVCKHNGPTNPLTGIISKKTRFDDVSTDYVKRLGYHTQKLFLKYKDNTQYIPFYNSPTQFGEEQKEVFTLSGPYYYSFSGSTEWEADGSSRSAPIDVVETDELPQLGFGYYRVIKPIPPDTTITCRDTIILTVYLDSVYYVTTTDTTIKFVTVTRRNCDACEREEYRLNNPAKCIICDVHGNKTVKIQTITSVTDTITIQIPQYVTVEICDTIKPGPPPDTIPEGCFDNVRIDPDANCRGCSCVSGTNDDWKHPERFINQDGTLKCAEGVVIFDHHITPKFQNVVIPEIEAETGTRIDLNDIDFYITNPANGQQVIYHDIFHWCGPDGKRTIFNTNEEVLKVWPELRGKGSYDFLVDMIHRPTGLHISILFRDHDTMTLFL